MVTFIIESISVGVHSDMIRRSRTRLGLLKNKDNLIASLDIFIYHWKKTRSIMKAIWAPAPIIYSFLSITENRKIIPSRRYHLNLHWEKMSSFFDMTKRDRGYKTYLLWDTKPNYDLWRKTIILIIININIWILIQ